LVQQDDRDSAGAGLAAGEPGSFQMRQALIFTALAAAVLAAASPCAAATYEGPWCANVSVGEDSFVERCDMPSYERCRQEIIGQGASYCTQNPYFRPNSAEPRLRARAKQRPDR
jgi:hypothetical protein